MIISNFVNCFLIKPKNADPALYCSCNNSIIIDEIASRYNNSIFISEIENKLSVIDKEYEVTVCYDDFLSQEDLKQGLFEEARIDFFIYDFERSFQTEILKRGFVVAIELRKYNFTFKVSPLMKFIINRKINDVYSKCCRADFGDQYCKIDIKVLSKQLGYIPKCDKTKKSCTQYNNSINFRGE